MTSNGFASRMYWIHAITPLHVGSGRGTGFIDLPIMREKMTGWPILPGSSFKGAWLDHVRNDNMREDFIKAAFGEGSSERSSGRSGSLAVTDARVVLFPVRSYYGTFAFVTSRLAITRLARDITAVGVVDKTPSIPEALGEQKIVVTTGSALASEGKVFFEDLDFQIEQGRNSDADGWASFFARNLFPTDEDVKYREILKDRLAIVSDSVFDFLCSHSTEVNARIKIDNETKTAKDGGLWYEESLPAETVMAGIVWCDRIFGSDLGSDALLDELCQTMNCQMGGKATTGKGYVRCLFTGKGA